MEEESVTRMMGIRKDAKDISIFFVKILFLLFLQLSSGRG